MNSDSFISHAEKASSLAEENIIWAREDNGKQGYYWGRLLSGYVKRRRWIILLNFSVICRVSGSKSQLHTTTHDSTVVNCHFDKNKK